MPNRLSYFDFNDTFLDVQHLKDSFPGCDVRARGDEKYMKPPFKSVFFAAHLFCDSQLFAAMIFFFICL